MNKTTIASITLSAIALIVAVVALTHQPVQTPATKGGDIVEQYPSIWSYGLRLNDNTTFETSSCFEQVATSSGKLTYIQVIASSTATTSPTWYVTTTKPATCS